MYSFGNGGGATDKNHKGSDPNDLSVAHHKAHSI